MHCFRARGENIIIILREFLRVKTLLTLGRTGKLIPHRGTGGGGVDEPPLGFRYVTIFQKVFTFSRKPVMCSTG